MVHPVPVATTDRSDPPKLSALASLLSLLAAPVLAGGCAGGGRFDIISMQMGDLDEDRPLMSTFHPGECYYWIDEEGKINVAMHYENIPLLGRFSRVSFDLSFELDDPPAGRARQYQLRSREFRGTARLGALVHRFMSYQGVGAIWQDGPGRFRGRFRTLVRHESFSVLTGWVRAAPLLFLGEFRAVLDAERGRAINQASESGGWPRPPRSKVPLRVQRPATQPATTQPGGSPATEGGHPRAHAEPLGPPSS